MHALLTHKQVENYILSKPGSKLDYPFGEDVAVYKVFVPGQSSASHSDLAPGAREERTKPYKGTAKGAPKRGNAALGGKQQRATGFARGQAGAVRGDWKMYALIAEGKTPVRISLKCDPRLAESLREKYESVLPGYHLNKKHWNTVILSGQLAQQEVFDLIDHSYNLVAQPQAKSPS